MTKVLIIDDSKFTRSQIRKALRSLGFDTAEAVNGREALQMVQSFQPDAITLDLLMPELDGMGFLSALRESGSDLPVVVITADIQSDIRKQCKDFGALFLNKPFQGPDLVAALSEHGLVKEVSHGT